MRHLHILKNAALRRGRRGAVALLLLFSLLLCGVCCGCAALTNPVADGVPVSHVDPVLLGASREPGEIVPMNFFQRPAPLVYELGPGDVLGIYIEGVLDAAAKAPETRVPEKQRLTPGRAGLPSALGYPIGVRADGTISLPQIKPIAVQGKTLEETEKAIRKTYTVDEKILKPGRDRVVVTLLNRRVQRVLVFRRDLAQGWDKNMTVTRVGLFGSGAALAGKGLTGAGMEIDLVGYENDLLHALALTGGFPGTNADKEILIFRNPRIPRQKGDSDIKQTQATLGQPRVAEKSAIPEFVPIPSPAVYESVVRVPIRVPAGQLPQISLDDIILNNGDVVLVRKAPVDTFYTGGLLPPGEHILPPDYDLDVVEAVARVRGPLVNGAFGGSNLSGLLINPGIGNPNPSSLTVVRRLPDGGQIPILVDLNKALVDARERILVQPRDVLILQETRHQAIARYFSQVFDLGGLFTIIRRRDGFASAGFVVP